MKKIKGLFALLLVAMVAIAPVFVSCGDDDDNGGGVNDVNSKLTASTWKLTGLTFSNATEEVNNLFAMSMLYQTVTLTFHSDGTFTSAVEVSAQGTVVSSKESTGTWSLNDDASAIIANGASSISIKTLTSNNLVLEMLDEGFMLDEFDFSEIEAMYGISDLGSIVLTFSALN